MQAFAERYAILLPREQQEALRLAVTRNGSAKGGCGARSVPGVTIPSSHRPFITSLLVARCTTVNPHLKHPAGVLATTLQTPSFCDSLDYWVAQPGLHFMLCELSCQDMTNTT
jgi:hypothetical protein